MAYRVVHRVTKDGGNFADMREALTDLNSSVGNYPYTASKVAGENSLDGGVADVDRTATFIAPNIIECVDVWVSEEAKNNHYQNRVIPAFVSAGKTKGSAPGGWTRTVISQEEV